MSEAATSKLPQIVTARSDSTDAYGWVMVAVAALAMVATLPGRTHGLGMITERLLLDPELNLSRTGFGQINLWATLIGSLFCLAIGSLIDRFGIRLMLSVVMFALGGVVLAMTRVETQLFLFIAITLSRGFGQSALSVVSITIVGKWFDRNISVPMAIYATLMASGFIAAALIGRDYADIAWREFWSVLGWCVVGLALLFTFIARNRGQLPLAAYDQEDERADTVDVNFTQFEAMRTPMFWVCALGVSLYGMIMAGISLFNESILVDRGFPKEVYYESLALGTGIGVVAKLVAGFAGIYLTVGRLLAVALSLLAGSLVWLTQLNSYTDVVCYVCLSAVAGGMLTVLFFSSWRQLFGWRHLGRIQGNAQMLTVLASAVGPLVFAQVREATGSYVPLIWVLSAVALITAVIAWFTPEPKKKSTTLGES